MVRILSYLSPRLSLGHSFGGLILERTVEHTLRTLQGQNRAATEYSRSP
jgi:hypothetical protein